MNLNSKLCSACLLQLIVSFGGFIHCDDRLVVLTVATEANDGFQRFMQSASGFGYNVTVLGLDQTWQGGDVNMKHGGRHKIILLQNALRDLERDANNSQLIVLLVDSYDVVFLAGPSDVVKTFKSFNANIVFSAEATCWPNEKLKDHYPDVKMNEFRYLNSGGFMGYLPQISSLIVSSHVDFSDDDQLYYTKTYLNASERIQLNMGLDSRSRIFQNLNGALDDVSVKFKGKTGYLYNHRTGNTPLIVHGNGPIKERFNSLTNYITGQWAPRYGCLVCDQDVLDLRNVPTDNLPTVFMAVFIEYPVAFLEDFLQKVANLNYPKSRIDLFLHYADAFHSKDVDNFVMKTRPLYSGIMLFGPESNLDDWTARNRAVKEFLKVHRDYFFSIDGDIHLENVDTLRHLIETNRSVIAPLVTKHGRAWSNFWGALSHNGYYKRSDDYLDILYRDKIGIWNVPYIASVYLVQGQRMLSLEDAYLDEDEDMDADMAFCKKIRSLGVFMYVDSQSNYGYIANKAEILPGRLHSDLFSVVDNNYSWEEKYLHPDYYRYLDEVPASQIEQPCPDVFWFPLFSPKFCSDLIEEMENYGQWSSGNHSDERLNGGYENVPTVDIHMNQIEMEEQWMFILNKYIVPLSEKVFEGYISEGRSFMNFVVRYKPDEQNHLSAHCDASTVTINVALNRAGIDYQGGGTHFVRYNCSILKSRLGWVLVHPGRLTHFHEGLPVVNGTRYILVSFVDP